MQYVILSCQRFAVAEAAAGAATAFLAWYPGHYLCCLLALPLAWAMSGGRRAALVLFAAYYLAGARDIAIVSERFFAGYQELDAQVAASLGVTLWVLQALLLALPWSLLKPSGRTSLTGIVCRATLATLLVTVPPIGIIGWLSPVHLASALYPEWRWFGMAFGVATIAAISVIPAFPRAWPSIIPLLALTVYAHLTQTPRAPPPAWQPVDTNLDRFNQSGYPQLYERTSQLRSVVHRSFTLGAKVVILPEEIAGLWRPAMALWWRDDIERMRDAGQTLVIGTDLISSWVPLRYTDSAVVTGAGRGRFDSRQPVPVALWLPGAKTSAVRGNTDQPELNIDGHRVAFSLCYEDLLWWPHWRALFARPDVMVSMSNDWFASNLALAHIQQQSIESVARLAGIPLLRATNR